jgi:hypothetical protein
MDGAGMDECSYEARKRGPTERVEVTHAQRRRRRSAGKKLQIGHETMPPGAIANVVSSRHGIGTGLLYTDASKCSA